MLLKRVEGKGGLNACVLDYLLSHTEAIPESWKRDEEGSVIYIYFTETQYSGSVGNLYVRCLFWCDGRWDSSCYSLERDFGGQRRVVLLASQLAREL